MNKSRILSVFALCFSFSPTAFADDDTPLKTSSDSISATCPNQFRRAKDIIEAYEVNRDKGKIESEQAIGTCFDAVKKAYDSCVFRPQEIRAVTLPVGINAGSQVLFESLYKAGDSAMKMADYCSKQRIYAAQICNQDLEGLHAAVNDNSQAEAREQQDSASDGMTLQISQRYLDVRHQLEGQIRNTTTLRDDSNKALSEISKCYVEIFYKAQRMAFDQKASVLASSAAGSAGANAVASTHSSVAVSEGVEIGKETVKEVAKDMVIDSGKSIARGISSGSQTNSSSPDSAATGAGEAVVGATEDLAASALKLSGTWALASRWVAGPAMMYFALGTEAGSSCDENRSPSELIANSQGCLAETHNAINQLNVGN